MSAATNIALPAIGNEFKMTAILLGWVNTSYLLAAAILLIPFGKISDLYGRKRIFLYGTIIFTISALLSSIAGSTFVFILCRIAQGIGSAMIFGTGVAILTSVYPVGERGKVLGINVATVYLGLSLGPFLGGLLTQHFGWRSIFLVNVPLGVIIVILTATTLTGEWLGEKGEFDLIGSSIFGLALVAVMLGLSRLPGRAGLVLLLLGVALVFWFIGWETRSKNPVLDMSLFRHNVTFAFSNVAALINYCATSAVGFLLSLYLQYVKGLSPQAAGMILISQPVVQAIFSPVAGYLSDRIEPRIVASVGMGLGVIGLFLLSFLSRETIASLIFASLIVLGFGFALFSSPNTNAIMSSVEKKYYGVASATLATMRLMGQMLSMGIATSLFAIHMGRVKITAEYYPQFLVSAKTAFIIFAILSFCGIFASLARGKVRNNKNKK